MIEWMPKVKINYLKDIKMDFKDILNDLLKQPENDSPKFVRHLADYIYRDVEKLHTDYVEVIWEETNE